MFGNGDPVLGVEPRQVGCVFALRFSKDTCWQVFEDPRSPDAVRGELAHAKPDLEDLRFLPIPTKRPDASYKQNVAALLALKAAGWRIDLDMGGWRAPEEGMGKSLDSPDPIEDVFLHFEAPLYGWINVRVEANKRTHTLLASHFMDPFADLLTWLEHIAKAEDTAWVVNEEGNRATLVALNQDDSADVQILAAHAGNRTPRGAVEPFLNVSIPRSAFVRRTYERFRSYAFDDFYDPRQWTTVSVREDLKQRCPNWTLDTLLALNGLGIGAVFDALYPKVDFYSHDHAVAAWKRGQAGHDKDPLDSSPYASPFPLDYDSWSLEHKRNYVEDRLDRMLSEWDGDDLLGLKSSAIEAYIRQQEDV